MLHIRDNAEQAVRQLLKRVAKERGTKLEALDYMDDGTPIQLAISIDSDAGSAVFDFEGTGPEMIGQSIRLVRADRPDQFLGNLNCPLSVTYSAIIYCLRSMVDMDVRS